MFMIHLKMDLELVTKRYNESGLRENGDVEEEEEEDVKKTKKK